MQLGFAGFSAAINFFTSARMAVDEASPPPSVLTWLETLLLSTESLYPFRRQTSANNWSDTTDKEDTMQLNISKLASAICVTFSTFNTI
jgi:hypothetical protein